MINGMEKMKKTSKEEQKFEGHRHIDCDWLIKKEATEKCCSFFHVRIT